MAAVCLQHNSWTAGRAVPRLPQCIVTAMSTTPLELGVGWYVLCRSNASRSLLLTTQKKFPPQDIALKEGARVSSLLLGLS